MFRRNSVKRVKYPVHHCTWQNRMYALTISAIFFFFSLGFTGVLQFTGGFRSTSNTVPYNMLALKNASSKPPSASSGLYSRQIINRHDFRYIINQRTDLCNGKTVSLLIFVTSSPKNFQQRIAIRETWGNPNHLAPLNAALFFLLGNPQDMELQSYLLEENKVYGDILQEDFVDSYKNLTLKSVMALKWTTHYCPNAKALMKTDDDMYVNVPLLLQNLQTKSKKRWIVGCIKTHTLQPVHLVNGKPVYDSPVIAPPGHPPFVAGAGYVISGDIIQDLYEASLRLRLIPVEDVFITAHCGRAINVKPEHDSRFSCGNQVNEDCSMAFMFTGHKITPTRQYHIWSKLHNTNECSDNLANVAS